MIPELLKRSNQQRCKLLVSLVVIIDSLAIHPGKRMETKNLFGKKDEEI